MGSSLRSASFCIALLFPTLISGGGQTPTGNGLKVFHLAAAQPTPASAPTSGFALVGGGSDVDEAMEFLCQHSNGGNVLVLRASGDDAYNPYFHTLCPHNSVTTLLITSAEAARDPVAIEQVRSAHAIFIAGGDQSNYVKFWAGNPLRSEINEAIARGVPIGGISAGLAVLGEFVFSARLDTVTSSQALADPYDPHVTLDRDFLVIPILTGVITDSHFMARGRMGRTLAFLARMVQDNWVGRARAIGIDEGTAVLIEPGGNARVIGRGSAYFIELPRQADVCTRGKPLTAREFTAYKVSPGQARSFDVKTWAAGPDAKPLFIQVVNGLLTVTGG